MASQYAAPLEYNGSDQNSYIDQDYDHSFFDTDSYYASLSPSQLEDRGIYVWGINYWNVDVDPEFTAAVDESRLAQAALAVTGNTTGSDFVVNRNGHSISFNWHATPGGSYNDSNNVLNVTGNSGYYTTTVNYNPFGGSTAGLGYANNVAGQGYRTYTNFDYGDPVSLITGPDRDRGALITDYNGDIIYRPENITPQEIYDHGRAYRNASWSETSAMLQILFKQGGRYDFQRQGGDRHALDTITDSGFLFHREYRSFSTVAIGLFAAGAGISESQILTIQNTYAGFRSNFGRDERMDTNYTNLAALNVANTHLGFIMARDSNFVR